MEDRIIQLQDVLKCNNKDLRSTYELKRLLIAAICSFFLAISIFFPDTINFFFTRQYTG